MIDRDRGHFNASVASIQSQIPSHAPRLVPHLHQPIRKPPTPSCREGRPVSWADGCVFGWTMRDRVHISQKPPLEWHLPWRARARIAQSDEVATNNGFGDTSSDCNLLLLAQPCVSASYYPCGAFKTNFPSTASTWSTHRGCCRARDAGSSIRARPSTEIKRHELQHLAARLPPDPEHDGRLPASRVSYSGA